MSPAPGATTPAILGRAELLDDVRGRVFAPSTGPERVGAEVELIPVDPATGAVLPLRADPGSVSTLGFLEAHGERLGWRPSTTGDGVPGFALPGGGAVTVEPGGQVEYSSPVLPSVDALVERLDAVVAPLVAAGREAGVAFVTRGLDPLNPVGEASLQLDSERYRRMAAHYDRRGPWGRRMMRQSAAIHVNLDSGDAPLERWAVAQRAVPAWTAIFANSPRAEGRETGHRSIRAAQWRRLDPTRTGLLPPGEGAVERYLDFAVRAEAFLLGAEEEAARPLACWLDERRVDVGIWRRHLSTLFPEVRPRGYLEIRCFDALPPRWYAAPLVLAAGLLQDPEACRTAAEILGPVDPALLVAAGREGLGAPAVAAQARDVATLALEGAARAKGRVGGRSLEVARAFVDELTRRGRDPGHLPGDRA